MKGLEGYSETNCAAAGDAPAVGGSSDVEADKRGRTPETRIFSPLEPRELTRSSISLLE